MTLKSFDQLLQAERENIVKDHEEDSDADTAGNDQDCVFNDLGPRWPDDSRELLVGGPKVVGDGVILCGHKPFWYLKSPRRGT